MNRRKQLWVLAGGNGAGKSTFYRIRLQPLGLPIINADMIAKELFPKAPEERSYDAAQIATDIRNNLLLEGRNFCFETVFSHPSKIDFIAQAKVLGYEVFLVFIHLETISLNKARISQRVKEGGHNVPEIKVENRIPRLLENIKTAIPLCDHVYILDNSSAENPFQLLASIKLGKINILQSKPPHWIQNLLNNYH